MASGVLEFLDRIEKAKDTLANEDATSNDKNEYIRSNFKQKVLHLMRPKNCYYEDPDYGPLDITLYTGFSKEALARILIELDILSIID